MGNLQSSRRKKFDDIESRGYSKAPLGGWLARRSVRAVVPVLLFIILVAGFLHIFDFLPSSHSTSSIKPAKKDENRLPPLYYDYHNREIAQSRQLLDAPYPNGRTGKYIFMANRVDNLGWGNAMQEFLLNAYLAYRIDRAHVFDNYTWNQYGGVYTEKDGHLIPSRIPYSVFLQGPLVGGPWPENDPAPRSVVKEYWDEVCPEKFVLNPRDVDSKLDGEIPLKDLFEVWIKALTPMKERCIEMKNNEYQLFMYYIFGNAKRLLTLWPEFSQSPIIQEFRWSPLIEAGFHDNRKIFLSSAAEKSVQDTYPYSTIPGLLALHIRRGDFKDHCKMLVDWNAVFMGYNSFPEFVDKFTVPEGAGAGMTKIPNTQEAIDTYLQHCYPNIRQIVAKVEDVRQSQAGKGLKNIFIMSNGDDAWLEKLKKALNKAGHWEKITTTKDMTLNWEQEYVSQAVDMLIGQRAQVLVGNGFSSLTSNVVMLRMANKNIPPESNRFW
ncbi:hypothetical protein C8Q75DRAFT_878732 [Abortiporus biennis]|nr:hypothetical protein C8Q75DRAFT_878732 [Abortiporus biennis]